MAGCFCRCVTVLFGTILFSVLAMQSLRDLHQCHYAATVIGRYYPLEVVKEEEVKGCSTNEVIMSSTLLAANVVSAVGLVLTACLEKKALFMPAIIFTATLFILSALNLAAIAVNPHGMYGTVKLESIGDAALWCSIFCALLLLLSQEAKAVQRRDEYVYF